MQSQQTYVKLKWSRSVVFNPTGNSSSYTLRANDLFDPDTLDGNSHPTGFTQWMSFYKNYCVLGSKIIVDVVNRGATNPAHIFLYANNQPNLANNSNFYNNAGTMLKQLTPAGGSHSTTRMKMYNTTKRVFGAPVVNNEVYWGTAFASPPTIGRWYWHLYALNPPHITTSENINLTILIRMKFYCRLFNRITDLPLTAGLTSQEFMDDVDYVPHETIQVPPPPYEAGPLGNQGPQGTQAPPTPQPQGPQSPVCHHHHHHHCTYD